MNIATKDYADPFGVDPTAPPKKFLTGILVGFCIGFFVAAGGVSLVRAMDSETDGFNALTQAFLVFIPLLLLTVLVWFLRRNVPGTTYKPGVVTALIAGLIAGGFIWITCPTEQQKADELWAQHSDRATELTGQLARFRDEVDQIPVGTASDITTPEQLEKLRKAEMVFGYSEWGLDADWNALLTAHSEYARLKPGTDPDSIMDSWDIPEPEFNLDRSMYESPVDRLAEATYSEDNYLFAYEVEQMVPVVEQLRYVVIVRMTDRNPPVLTGEMFRPGYFCGEAFVFDCAEDEMIGAFDFASTNADEVEYTYEENSSVTSVANSAAGSLESDLKENSWLAFWHKLHSIADNANSDQKNEALPYEMSSLDEAMLLWLQDKEQRDREQREVREELERRGVAPSDG